MKYIDFESTLGIYARGTDYTRLKPKGCTIQPSIQMIISKANEYIQKYHLKKIFLVTEDNNVYSALSKEYGNSLMTASFDSFVTNYNGTDFLSKSPEACRELGNSPYYRGVNYLVKLLLLSKCHYLVSGVTNGSWAVNVFSEGFEDAYWFNLGRY